MTGPDGAEIDCHPLRFAPDGSALQAARDLHDMARLREKFGVATHF
nr:hypothetical protein GCM10025732_39280 [Glycomyces mayteni]